ncbi:WecB/TagA/CpsF family glycosyltransferase [Piscinibacter sp.]|uniref:WecB/TagA/CpsF family glycosyltransferase n=1 Tax=Piscinibacter sp. TaxID=1903157 RepID=UPI002C7B9A3B|nr:WecB/TagA/CpsF family glycosyltransferase [Albitalea sp.]HUG23783.1 WecB/TagA/CpsF family glycosyltransferase [Albitalea sp.]
MPLGALHAPAAAASNAAAAAALAQADFERDVHCLLGLPFDAVDMATTVATVRDAARTGRRCFVSTPNLNFAMAARSDAAFRDSVLRSHLSLADGMPLVWVARLLNVPIRERIAGAGVFEQLREHSPPSITAYFFGGPPGAADAACESVNRSASGLRCVGAQAPGFGSVEEVSSDACIDPINRSGAQFVIAALGAKKGQAWLEHNAQRLRAPVLCHLGAVVNFAAGTVSRAPRWMQAAGMEWLWRIKEEPQLWRRYGADGVMFLRLLFTRVLPCAWRIRRHAADSGQPATLSVDERGPDTTIACGGAWTRDALAPLRAALAEAAQRRACVSLLLNEVSYVDSAFLGLLLIARGAFGDTSLNIAGADTKVARLFYLHGAEFLLRRTA